MSKPLEPDTSQSTPETSADAPGFGWTAYAERVNGGFFGPIVAGVIYTPRFFYLDRVALESTELSFDIAPVQFGHRH